MRRPYCAGSVPVSRGHTANEIGVEDGSERRYPWKYDAVDPQLHIRIFVCDLDWRRPSHRTRLASNCSVTLSIGVLLACGSDTVTIDGVGTGPELGQQVSARLVERLQLVVRAAWAGMSCCSGPERRRRHRDIQGPWNGAALRTRLLRWLAAFSRSSRSLQLLSFFHFWARCRVLPPSSWRGNALRLQSLDLSEADPARETLRFGQPRCEVPRRRVLPDVPQDMSDAHQQDRS
jgi:hypothetical protein